MGPETAPEVANQIPAVFCGPTADVAFFVAIAIAVFGLSGIYKLLTNRINRSSLASEDSTDAR